MTAPQRDVAGAGTPPPLAGQGDRVLRVLAGDIFLSAIILAIIQPSLRREDASRQPPVTSGVAGQAATAAGSAVSANQATSSATLAAGTAATAAATATSAQKPFDAPSKVVPLEARKFTQDFGLVDLGSTHRVTLGVKNSSAQPVRLARVRSECACLSGRISRLELPPGETASFEVTFGAHKEPILYSGRILLQAAEGPPVAFIMTIQARVGLPLTIEPATLDLGRLVVGEERRREVKMVNNGPKPWWPLYASSTVDGCIALVPRAEAPANGTLAIPVALRTSARSSGAGQAEVRIQTNCPQQPTLAVPVRYEVSTRYALSAGRLEFGRLASGGQVERLLTVTAGDAAAGALVKECSLSAAAAVVGKTDVTYDGARAVVRCRLEGRKAGQVEGLLKLLLAGHEEPVEVTISGEVAGGS